MTTVPHPDPRIRQILMAILDPKCHNIDKSGPALIYMRHRKQARLLYPELGWYDAVDDTFTLNPAAPGGVDIPIRMDDIAGWIPLDKMCRYETDLF